MSETTTATDVATRKVIIVTTKGEKQTLNLPNGLTKSALEPLLRKANVALDNMKIVEGGNNTTLEHPDAVVPDGKIYLFLMQLDSKGGAKASKAAPKKAAAKEAAPKKAAKKAAVKAAPKKTVKKTKVAASVEEPVEPETPDLSDAEAQKKLRNLANNINGVKNVY